MVSETLNQTIVVNSVCLQMIEFLSGETYTTSVLLSYLEQA